MHMCVVNVCCCNEFGRDILSGAQKRGHAGKTAVGSAFYALRLWQPSRTVGTCTPAVQSVLPADPVMHCQSLLPGWLPCLASKSQLQSMKDLAEGSLLTASVSARLVPGSCVG